MNYLFIIVLATTSLICSDRNYRGPVSPNRIRGHEKTFDIMQQISYASAVKTLSAQPQERTKHLVGFLMRKRMYQDKNQEHESFLLFFANQSL